MAYDETLAERVRELLAAVDELDERKMFGGISFMLGGNYCCGVLNDDLVVRLGAGAHDQALSEPHVRDMDFTGRPMLGWVYVAPDGTTADGSLAAWVKRGVAYARSLPPR